MIIFFNCYYLTDQHVVHEYDSQEVLKVIAEIKGLHKLLKGKIENLKELSIEWKHKQDQLQDNRESDDFKSAANKALAYKVIVKVLIEADDHYTRHYTDQIGRYALDAWKQFFLKRVNWLNDQLNQLETANNENTKNLNKIHATLVTPIKYSPYYIPLIDDKPLC